MARISYFYNKLPKSQPYSLPNPTSIGYHNFRFFMIQKLGLNIQKIIILNF